MTHYNFQAQHQNLEIMALLSYGLTMDIVALTGNYHFVYGVDLTIFDASIYCVEEKKSTFFLWLFLVEL
jgi:hypothetical protein